MNTAEKKRSRGSRMTTLFGLLCALSACNPLGSRSTVGGGDGTGPDGIYPVLVSSSLTNLDPFTVSLSWNTPVTGFVLEDLSVTNGAPSAFTGSGTDYTFSIAPVAEGVVTITIAAGAALSTTGEQSTAATLTVTYDLTNPDVAVNIGASQAEATGSLPVSFRAVFSEVIDPTTFTAADVTNAGSATGVTWTVTNLGDDKTFDVKATALSGTEGSLSPSVPAGTVSDVAGNINNVSTSTTNRVAYFSNYASIKLWLRADALAYANGASVVSWADSSSFANTCTEATNPPTFLSPAQNGIPAVRFAGGSSILRSNSASAMTGNPDFTLFIVTRVNSVGPNFPVFLQIGETSASGATAYFGTEGTGTNIFTGFYSGGTRSNAGHSAAFAIYTWVRSSGGGANGMQVGNSQYWNGAAAAVSTSLSPGAVNLVDGLFRIGRSTLNATADADIGELIVFDGTALSNAQRTAVESYLNNKWAVF
jgi:hypothetical protein